MNGLLDSLESFDRLRPAVSLEGLLLALLLAFVLGVLLARTYSWTHEGLSYSRSFTQSLVIMSVVITVLMAVIGDSIVTAFGLLGALALVRFRNVLKDTRDTVFVLMAIVIGVSVGTQRFVTGIIGTAAMLALVWYLESVSFGAIDRFHGYLTVRLAARPATYTGSEAVLTRYCLRYRQVSKRQSDQDESAEVVYQVGLRDRNRVGDLVAELRKVDGVSHATALVRDEVLEV